MKNKRFRLFHRAPARIIVLIYFAVMLIGGFLLSIPWSNESGEWLNYGDALFTSVSAVSVTGMVVHDTAVQFSFFGQLIILLLVQIGGIGCMGSAMLLFFLMRRRISLSERVMLQESINKFEISGIVRTFRNLLLFVFVTELAGALILMFSFIPMFGWGEGIWKSLFLSISAFCNSGFDIMGAADSQFISLAELVTDVSVQIPVMILIILGGFGFLVVGDLSGVFKSNIERIRNRERGRKKLSFHTKVVLTVSASLIVLGTSVFMALEWNEGFRELSGGHKFLAALFQSVTMRTAGFCTVDQSALTEASVAFTSLLMFVGASPGSTGGGIKTTTFFVLCVIIIATLRGKKNISFKKRNIGEGTVRKCLAVLFLAVFTIAIAVFLICVIERNNPALDSLGAPVMNIGNIIYETISSFSTVGLSRGVVANATGLTKAILAFVMFTGRVGVMTLGYAIAKTSKSDTNIQYSDAKIMIG